MSDPNDDTSHYEGALLEDMDSKLDAILEGQASLADVPDRLTSIEGRLGLVEGELRAVKIAVRDEFKDLKHRVTKLERASAS